MLKPPMSSPQMTRMLGFAFGAGSAGAACDAVTPIMQIAAVRAPISGVGRGRSSFFKALVRRPSEHGILLSNLWESSRPSRVGSLGELFV